MKRYKLIKMYPGVYINVGDIVFEKFDGCYFPEAGGNAIGSPQVENFPEFWEEVKEIPLFITEDGVEYFNDQESVWTAMNQDIVNSTFISTAEIHQAQHQNTRKFFSTKSATENYLKCNWKCLSFNDVWNMSQNKDSKNCYVIIGKSDLQKLIKERMSQL